MKYDDFIKKLESIKTPDIELPGHRQLLKTFLLSSGRFRERSVVNWAKVFAPVAAAVLLITLVGVFGVGGPGPVYLGGLATLDASHAVFTSRLEADRGITPFAAAEILLDAAAQFFGAG